MAASDNDRWLGNRSLGFSLVGSLTVFFCLACFTQPAASGLRPYYEDFKRIIQHSFDIQAAHAATPTFPMWGYGWLLLVTENSLVLILIQFAGSVGSLLFFLSTAVKTTHLTPWAARTAWWLVLAALPWYATHLGAYSASSLAGSLILLAFAGLLRAQASAWPGALCWLAGAGACFGFALNFRSDAHLLPLAIGILLLWLTSWTWRRRISGAAIWLATTYAMLIPWMIYTRATVGHPLLTSTNRGHVLFIGLGRLPGNPWGITPSDGDPVMAAALREHFGGERSSLTDESDKFLQRRFGELIRAAPSSYLRKCVYSAGTIVIEGFYPGVFDPEYRDRIRAIYPWQATSWILLHNPRIYFTQLRAVTVLALVSDLQARLLLVGSLVGAILLGCRLRRERNFLVLLSLLAVGYQLLLNVLADYMRLYANAQFIPLMILLAVALDRWKSSRQAFIHG